MEVAAYSIATLIPDQVRGFVKNMSQMLVPKYSQTENTAIILKSFPKRSLQIFILSAICTLVYIATSPIIYSLLFPKFIDTIYLTQLFSLIILTNVVYLPLSLLMVKTSEKELYTLNIGGALFQGALFVMLIPTFGILGAIYTRILYRFIFTILTYVMCYKSK